MAVPKKGPRNPVVIKIMQNIKSGKRSMSDAYAFIKEQTSNQEDEIVQAVIDLSETLCDISYFSKSLEVLELACKDNTKSLRLMEEAARISFI